MATIIESSIACLSDRVQEVLGISQHRSPVLVDEITCGKYEAMLGELTLEEKVAILSGKDFTATNGVERLGIRGLKTVDAVNGVKGNDHFNGTKTACFPSTNAYGATWNTALLKKVGQALARQAKYKAAQAVLGPSLNMHRDPRGGRNFECFSEDPLLTGHLAAALVDGIQSQGVAAVSKHFVANDSETKRRSYNVDMDYNSRPLREIYMAAFQHMLEKTAPYGIMTAYNKLGGTHCDQITAIEEVIHGEWKYDGLIMSDWFGTKSGPASIKAGLDLEMPGPSVFRGAKLVEDVLNGAVEESTVDSRARNVLRFMDRTVRSHSSSNEISVIDDEGNRVARQTATEAVVLLKNDSKVLPLNLSDATKVAVIGANPPVGGGGSACAPPQYVQDVFECIKEAHTAPTLVSRSPGVKTHVTIPLMPLSCAKTRSGLPGFDLAYFNAGIEAPVHTETCPIPLSIMLGQLKPGIKGNDFHYSISTTFTAPSSGHHHIGAQCTGSFRLLIDSVEILNHEASNITIEDLLFVPAKLERKTRYHMTAGRSYKIELIVQPHRTDKSMGEPAGHGAKLTFLEEYSDSALIADAVAKAEAADVSIIFAGRSAEYESEGYDMESIKLPQNQVDMILAVAKASPRSVLVLSCGNAIDVSDFCDDVDAILCMGFGGQEGCQAITDILSGKEVPSGRLPMTWWKRLEDSPSFGSFPAKQNERGWEIRYAEGLQMGYRSDDSTRARYPFGYGLSYVDFQYSDLRCYRDGLGNLEVAIVVKNTGTRSAKEVVQVYVSDLEASVWRPAEELKAFEKITLEAGVSQLVRLTVPERHAFSFWDAERRRWRAEAGEFEVRVGDLRSCVVLEEGFDWHGL